MSTLPRGGRCDYKRPVPRVLIPSDHPDFPRYLARAYKRAGWDAAVGVRNFDLTVADYDLVHVQWPEEFASWKVPTDAQLGEILGHLDRWRSRAKVALTMHNLHPHREPEHPNQRRLYEEFLTRVPVIAHFTETSREQTLREYPRSANSQHVVTGFFNLDHLIPDGAEVTPRKGDDFVLLVFGNLREWAEVELIRDAFDQAKVPDKRLVMTGSYNEPASPWLHRWRRWTLARWLKSRGADVRMGYLPDSDLPALLAGVDAVVLPRFRALNSGLPALGASFGRAIIAPRCGAYPELLKDTPNPLYAPGDAADLARAIERAAALDRAELCRANRRLAESWGWNRMVTTVINTTAAATP